MLAFELDAQPQVVHRVGVAQCLVVGDEVGLEQAEQRLVEGLHAGLGGFGHKLFDFRHLAFHDEVGDQRRVDHHLHRRHTALGVLHWDQALRHHRLEIKRQVHQQLIALVLGEEIDDAIQRLVGVVRVQRRQAQMAGFGELDGVFHGLARADFTDQDHVRRLTQGVLERGFEALGIHADLTLGDEAVLVVVDILDRVLDGDDVAVAVLVAVADHGRERGGFARAGAADEQD